MAGFSELQRLGKALMLPIAVLPAAGLLLRLGAPDVLNIPVMKAIEQGLLMSRSRRWVSKG